MFNLLFKKAVLLFCVLNSVLKIAARFKAKNKNTAIRRIFLF